LENEALGAISMAETAPFFPFKNSFASDIFSGFLHLHRRRSSRDCLFIEHMDMRWPLF
jgi:hypothetical protein